VRCAGSAEGRLPLSVGRFTTAVLSAWWISCGS